MCAVQYVRVQCSANSAVYCGGVLVALVRTDSMLVALVRTDSVLVALTVCWWLAGQRKLIDHTANGG